LRFPSRLASAFFGAALLLGVAVGPAPAGARAAELSAGDQALVERAGAYLDSLASVRGRFQQTDARGQELGGTLYLKRPGLARFVYDPPSELLVVSDGRSVTVSDPRLKTTNRYPLSFTPLSLILSKHAGIGHGVTITRVTNLGDGFAITAHATAHPRAGQIILSFSVNPMRLTGWTLTDAEGQTTQVRLTSLAAAPLDASLFRPPSYYDRRQPASP